MITNITEYIYLIKLGNSPSNYHLILFHHII